MKNIWSGNQQWDLRIIGQTRSLMFLEVDDGKHGSELWKTDGTTKGTTMVKELLKGPAGFSLDSAIVIGDKLWFAGPRKGWVALWNSDGTAKGTKAVKHFSQWKPYSYIGEIGSAGGSCYLSATDGTHGLELWRSDGTSKGTVMVKDILAREGDGIPSGEEASMLGSTYFFNGSTKLGDFSLWSSDGSSKGTTAVKRFNPIKEFIDDRHFVVGGRLLLETSDPEKDRHFVWSTDGTRKGMRREKKLPGPIAPGFTADAEGKSFVVSDGGLHLLRWNHRAGHLRLATGITVAQRSHDQMAVMNGSVYFGSRDRDTWIPSLMASDGTTAGTRAVKSFSNNHSTPFDPVIWKGALYFLTTNQEKSQLWKSDGTEEGTEVMQEFTTNLADWLQLHPAGERLVLFIRPAHEHLRVLGWDGTNAPVELLSLRRFGSGDMGPRNVIRGGNEIFFSGTLGSTNGRIWRTDGTTDGTFAIWEGDTDGPKGASSFCIAGSHLYFAASDEAHGLELWRSDGTAAGTSIHADIVPGPGDSEPQGLRSDGKHLFFNARTEIGREPWILENVGNR